MARLPPLQPKNAVGETAPPSSTCMPPMEPPMTQTVLDFQVVDEPRLRPHHVVDGDDGKVEAVGLAVAGSMRSRPGGAHAPAQAR